MNPRDEITIRDYRIVMTLFSTVDPILVRQVRTQLAALETVSHSPTKNYGGPTRRSSDEAIGGKRPPGGDAEHPDRDDLREWAAFQESHYRRTVSYFRREIAGCKTLAGLGDIHREITETLTAWRTQARPTESQQPMRGHPQWKFYVATSSEDAGKLADHFGVTRRRINQIRQEYGKAA